MKNNTAITILLIFLVVMNGILLFLVLKKPERQKRPPRSFISHQLGFDEIQQQKFNKIDSEHQSRMRGMDGRSKDLKKYLFLGLGDSTFTDKKLDSVSILIGALSKEKEIEIFNYFKEIKKVCNEGQQSKLEAILSKALQHGPNRPPPPHDR
ncbi:hypothetical protein KIM67_17725 [Flagellimonas sp. 389]|uniref:hypothetical protein n=1 Tax=Flagellimonas sp. 389 TaxID=2835862 RepID=UPI001BD5768E|nr:hypothetical protein [Flagellimonas sp. 389]MBS9464268.1 hypothetical protein [Flagellimonas sp. 389]